MKKHLWIVLLILALLLCGCGKAAEPTAAPENTVPVPAEETTVPAETAAVQSQALPVVVTKNPTDEYLEYNWKTWFVAHADNATSVTWEFISPEGKLYSVAETVEKNPNLFLDVSKGDTIALEKAPLSLNGWSVQARFEGPGGSATTTAAKITVKQSLGVYDPIVSRYQAAIEARDKGDTNWVTYDVSEMILYADHVGYAMKDLDNNGIEELILAGMGYDIPEEPVVFEIYTAQNGSAVSVCRSQARARIFLMQDGKFYLEGSSGATSSNFSVMQYAPAGLQFLNGLYTVAAPDSEDNAIAYYYTTSNQFGDPALMDGDNCLDEKVAQTFLNSWRGAICLPELSFIA